MVGTPSLMSLKGRLPFRMSGSCQVTLPDVPEWSEGPPGCLGVVGRYSRLFGSGRETLSKVRVAHRDIWEWSEALPDVQEWSGGPP